MASSVPAQTRLDSISPRFLTRSLQEARDFYAVLGFTLDDEYGGGFFILSRDGVNLHFNVDDDPPTLLERLGLRRRRGRSVCWIGVKTGIEALHEACRARGLVDTPLGDVREYGFKEFFVNDPYGNLILLAQPFPEAPKADG